MPLEALRITITAYTASFRVPVFVGHQLTLPVPPLSTVFGLLSAAKGEWVMPKDVPWLAYRCDYKSKEWDLEFIVQIEREQPTQVPQPRRPPKTYTVLQREFLTFPSLTLYLPPEWEAPFRRPRYSLLLVRTQDVASVEEIAPTTLDWVSQGEVGGVLLPMELVMRTSASAWLQNLPVAFTNEPQRRPLRMQIFGVVDAKRPTRLQNADGWLVQDAEKGFIVPLYRREWLEGVSDGRKGASGEIRGDFRFAEGPFP